MSLRAWSWSVPAWTRRVLVEVATCRADRQRARAGQIGSAQYLETVRSRAVGLGLESNYFRALVETEELR